MSDVSAKAELTNCFTGPGPIVRPFRFRFSQVLDDNKPKSLMKGIGADNCRSDTPRRNTFASGVDLYWLFGRGAIMNVMVTDSAGFIGFAL